VSTPTLDTDGYTCVANVLTAELRPAVAAVFATLANESAGLRSGLDHDAVRELARSPAVRTLIEPIVGPEAFVFRATLFDKHAAANWSVAWHQDRVVPVQQYVDEAGYGPWSDKGDDGVFVEPPGEVLQSLLAVRIDVDGSGPANGGLRVLSGSHRDGVLSRERIAALVADRPAATPDVPPGGALVMRPLLLHGSLRATDACHRRIVHLELAPRELTGRVRFRTTLR
jgi:hypothetical protein